MTGYFSLPLVRAVRIAAASFVFTLAFPAVAQDQGTPPTPPADQTPPPAPPADKQTPPADAAAPAPAPTPETTATVPVKPLVAEKAPPPPAGKDTTQLEMIEVTGSRLKRTDYETAQPVVSISREDIERSGLTDINDILRHLTVAGNNSAVPANGRGFLTLGEVNLDLRNLGPQHTLLLVDGHRWVTGLSQTQPNVSDYNTIPTSIIERIDILKDGASAIYGSDAIAGVVNIITRKDYEGFGVTYHVGQYVQQGDGLNQQVSLDWGANRPGTSAFFNYSYTNQDRAATINRSFTASPIPTAGHSRWSKNVTTGRFVFIPAGSNGQTYNCPNLQGGIAAGVVADPTVSPVLQGSKGVPAGLQLCDLSLIPGHAGGNSNPSSAGGDYATSTPAYNRFLTDSLENPNQRQAMFLQLTQELSEHLSFTFSGFYNLRKTDTLSANLAFSGGNLADGTGRGAATKDNPTNPFGTASLGTSNGQDIGNSAAQTLGPGYGAWLIRLAGTQGNLHFIEDVHTLRLGGTFKGDFDVLNWPVSWDGGYIFSQSRIQERVPLERFDIVQQEMGNVVDPNTGNVTYSNAVCAPNCLDVFHGQPGLDYGLVNAAFPDTFQRNRSRQDIGFVNFSGEVPQLAEWLAGPLAIATGLEMRRDTYTSLIDPVIKQGGLVLLNKQQDENGNGYAREAYVELGVPILKDKPFANDIDLDIAGRYSAYPGFGSISTGKLGVRWQPISDLLLRGAFSTGFRAPSIAERFLPPAQSFEALTDPCTSPTKTGTVAANCQADGASAANGQAGSTPFDLWQGNQKLNPEKSTNLTYGVIYSPHYVPDLDLEVDFFKIHLTDFIAIGLGQYYLDSCYKQAQRNYCQYIHRQGSGTNELVYIDSPFFNFSKIDTEGVDFNVRYVLPTPEQFGRFKLDLNASYTSKYDEFIPQPGAGDKVFGLVGQDQGSFAGYPRWKAGTDLEWKRDLWSASWATRLAYHMNEPCQDSYGTADPSVAYHTLGLCSDPTLHFDAFGTPFYQNELKTVVYHNVQVGREFPAYNANIIVGVNNVLDQDPPISYSDTGSLAWFNYDPQSYEIPGRFGYMQVSFKF